MVMRIGDVRRILWRLNRIMGDIEAIRRGPKAVMRRQVRKETHRQVDRALRKIMGEVR